MTRSASAVSLQLRPTFDTSDFLVFGAPGDAADHVKLWSTDNDGARAVEAEAWVS